MRKYLMNKYFKTSTIFNVRSFHTKIFAGIAIAIIISNCAVAQSRFWTMIEGSQVPSEGVRKTIPEKYFVISIDNNNLKDFLMNLSSSPDNASMIELPVADGTQRSFKIWNTPVFTSALQAKFPDIHTYTATAADNPLVTAKIDYTPAGFHAMIFDGANTFFIDPYGTVNDGYYIVYYKKYYHRDPGNYMYCQFKDDMQDIPLDNGEVINTDGSLPPNTALKSNGNQRKTYRLALSCTGEYAQAVGGSTPTVTSVLSAMTTTINRVNGIYEREISATLVFIANEDNLIYLNPATDPFTANNDGDNLLDQNQNNTENVIADNAYDIGHIFSTGGGGIAQLASVCNNSVKAMGVTGSANPVGDAYDVDYVAHEMGHQFGAEHSFNGNQGACYGNGEPDQAYEPGSASTIMGYAGICGASNDLQQHSDDYFHATNLSAISHFITDGVWGGGGATCGTNTSGTTPPAFDFNAATYSIPYKTPFELTAPSATASPSDGISYCWEEWDLGFVSWNNLYDFGLNETLADTFTKGPAFRSFDPTATTTRVFPRIEKVLTHTLSYKGERISQVARTSKFKVTARNITNGWGTFNIPDDVITVNVINTGAPFLVTSPTTFTTWQTGSTQTVTWDVAQTNAAPINCSIVNIYISKDGGFTYPYLVAENVANSGSATITVPVNFNSDSVRVKVKGSGNIFFNVSGVNISIEGPTALNNTVMEHNLNIYPNPASDLLSIDYSEKGTSLEIAFYNTVGQKVYQSQMQGHAAIDTKSWARGIYFLHLYDAKQNAKVVKTISLK